MPSIDRRTLVMRYLRTEAGFPFAIRCRADEIGYLEGVQGLRLPAPFQGAWVSALQGIKAVQREWIVDEKAPGFRILVIRNRKKRSLDEDIVVMSSRAFAELTRNYYEGGSR